MDWYDMPASTFVSKCLKHRGNDAEFVNLFLAEMCENEDDLPLEEMCSERGSPSTDDLVDFSDLKFTKKAPSIVEGGFRVRFTGEIPGGCRDNPRRFPVDERLYFRLNLDSGEVVFVDPPQESDYGH